MTAPSSERLPFTAVISGTGAYLPERVLTNRDLETMVDTTDEWIVSRTGMRERRIAAPDEATSDLAAAAGRQAMEAAGVPPEEIDLVLVATITPDLPFPNTACLAQEKLGTNRAFCMGLEAACSGFVYGVEIARQFVAAGNARHVLVIGAEKMSAILDWTDRSSCVLFGDGAGAAVISRGVNGRGIIGSVLGSDGRLSGLLHIPAGGSRLPTSAETVSQGLHFLKMNGREVFRHAVTSMTAAARDVLDRCDMRAEDVDWIIPHQANLRIIRAIGDRLQWPPERFVINAEKFGNTSAASVPIALDEAVRDGRIREGDRVMLLVFGGGFTWGATLVEWGGYRS